VRTSLDLDLIQSACEGNPDAIEEVLSRYRPSLVGFARKYCVAADIEEAVQATLWTVYQKIGYLRTARAFISWTFQIVRHYCYRLLKANEIDPSTMLDPLDVIELIGEDDTNVHELKRDVIDALQHLPFTYRQVVVLRDLEGHTAPEVAALLGVSLEAVKSRLHRGRRLMREQLAHWQTEA